MTQRVCIVGGGATGVTLLWALAKAKQQGFAGWDYDVTVLHEPTPGLSGLGGHSATYPVEVNGNTYEIDLGVQMVAPAMYPNMMCMLALPELASVKLAPVDLKISCAFPPSGGVTPYWGNFPAYQSTDLYEQHAADCAMFGQLLTDEPILLAPLANYLAANGSQFADLTSFESFFLDPYMSIMNGYGQALLGDVLVPEIALLFNEGFASFVDSGTGFQRFVGGAITFVDALAQFAQVQLGSALHLVTPAQATAIPQWRVAARRCRGPSPASRVPTPSTSSWSRSTCRRRARCSTTSPTRCGAPTPAVWLRVRGRSNPATATCTPTRR